MLVVSLAAASSSRNAPPPRGEERCVTMLKTAARETNMLATTVAHDKAYYCFADILAPGSLGNME